MKEQVILVDKHDRPLGIMAKLEAHQKGLLHRAFSVFVFNSNGELLLQQRADNKYHSSGLWSNTCCSHPFPGEIVGMAAARRLKEEMGIICPLKPAFSFVYHADLDSGLIENEFDHVFFGYSDQLPQINKSEVKNYRYINVYELAKELNAHPEKYTVWLKKCINEVVLNFEASGPDFNLSLEKQNLISK